MCTETPGCRAETLCLRKQRVGLLLHCISHGKLVARVFGYVLCDSFSAYISFGVSNILSQM